MRSGSMPGTEARSATDVWGWSSHLWPLYCAFYERISDDLAEYGDLILAGLPKPETNLGAALPPGKDLSSLYSLLNDREDIKKFGKFYTPASVVSYALERLGYPGEGGGIVLDPACGTGAFLVEAARRFIAARPQASWEELAGAIRGIDVDPVAVLIARARVLRVALEAGLAVGNAPMKIECRDALLEGPGINSLQSSFPELSPNHMVMEGAQYIVGNPPYGKVHSSDPRVAPYRTTIFGHANLYGIFLALASDALGQGGRLGFVVPRSFASGLYFKNLRRHLLGALHFDEVTVFGSRKGVFPGVLQETLLLLATRKGGAQQGQRSQGATVVREPRNPEELAGNGTPVRAVVVPKDKLSLGPRHDHALVLSADPVAHEVLARVRWRSRPLADHGLKASTGRLVWNRAKEHLRTAPEPGTLRVYWPANVHPYVFDPDLRERTKPNYAMLNDRTRGALNHPEDLIITKRTSAKEQARRIEAGFVEGDRLDLADGFFLENHLNFVRRVSGGADLRVVSAVLNARITNALFAMINGNTQVSATELMLLPLPKDLNDAELARLAWALHTTPPEGRVTLVDAFERALWNAYELPEELAASFLGSAS